MQLFREALTVKKSSPATNFHLSGWLACISALLAVSLLAAVPARSSEDPGAATGVSQVAQDASTFIIPIDGVIDLGLAYFVKRSLKEAEQEGFDAVILNINTLGGRVDAALDIRDALEECKVPVTSYVNKRAISAGALICLATGRIAMAPGSTIGAATPISISPTGGAKALSEKEVSYVRGEFRATAERNGHSPLLAEAMVDADTQIFAALEDDRVAILAPADVDELRAREPGIRVEEISPKGKLLTMTAEEAKRYKLAESTPQSLDKFIASLGLNPERQVTSLSTWSERLVRFLTHPIVSGLLLTLGVLGIIFELQMPGWGISGTVGAILLVLFFGGHYLAGLASAMDVLLFVVGLGLIALEIFVVPGFGVTGISGILCVLAAVYLALVDRAIPEFSWDFQRLNSVLLMFLFVLLGILAGTVAFWKLLPHTGIRRLLVLSASEEPHLGYTAGENLATLVGSFGTSLTHLRPAGKVLLGQRPLEAQTLGEFIEKNRPVQVIKVVGNKVFVAEQAAERETS